MRHPTARTEPSGERRCKHRNPNHEGGIFIYRTAGSDRQHPFKRGEVRLERVGYICDRCGEDVIA